MGHSSRRINALLSALGGRRYLEIGVSAGMTFREVEAVEKTGVDPSFAFDTSELLTETVRLLPITSDEFFSSQPLLPAFDAVFLDGLHTFEQTLRDFHNSLIRSHLRSVILIDDTLPNDVYSSLPDADATFRYRKAAKSDDPSWHGDVYKLVFFLHDFWPSLDYRTLVGSGNPQTLVWRTNRQSRTGRFNSLERISRLTYFDLQENLDILQECSEEEGIEACLKAVKSF